MSTQVKESGQTEKKSVPIVGVGASAGGYDALQEFFASVEPGTGIAFVVVQHLDPDHKSVLSDLLRRHIKLPVVLVEADTEVKPDTVYVIPPNANLTTTDGMVKLTKPTEARGYRSPIDIFFTSLAGDLGEDAACVILSGTGSDGTLGLRAVKEHGGLTLAQADAEYDGMMRSALATGLVDFVLPARQLAAKAVDYFRQAAAMDAKPLDDSLNQVFALLRARTGHDFSNYKDKTVIRRIQRRMQVLQQTDVGVFIETLRKDPREIDLLFNDLLIGVTNFFRDPKAFAALEEKVIPALLANRGPDDTVRVWVAGCATGEEAYSIAILLRERMPKTTGGPKLQIFASDIDEHALETARIGRYPAAIAKDVPAQRLERYFTREDGTYRIASDLREICLFSLHNVLRDAPFSKIDLISCRNLLIYLNPDLQNRIIPLFHYALREDGYLFLGTSENVTRHPRLFTTVDKPNRIFKRRALVERRLPEFPLTATDPARLKPNKIVPISRGSTLIESAERLLLEYHAPAYVVIDASGDVLHTSPRTGKYLELPAGAPDHNIFSLARKGLRLDLRAAVHKATSSSQPVVQSNVSVGTNGGRQVVDLTVRPLAQAGTPDALYLVLFQDVGSPKPSGEQDATQQAQDTENANLRQLEDELRATKERLQTTTEELESANEELKSGNEELSSMNEELQSANEELETSREELQSINEELQTVNSELNTRVEELSRTNSDMANLLESTQIATVFLDRNLAVKSFTPAAKDVFRLVESDTGRPISHVRARFNSDTVENDAARVLRTLATIEHEVQSIDGEARYIMRIMPYRTVENVINGVVITFTDVTRIAAAEARINELTLDLRNRIDSLTTLLDLVPAGVLIAETSDPSSVRINRHAAELLGEAPETKGRRVSEKPIRLYREGSEIPAEAQPLQMALSQGKSMAGFECQILHAGGHLVDVTVSAAPVLSDDRTIRGAIAVFVDISRLKEAEGHHQVLLHELQHRVKNILATVSALAQRLMQGKPSLETFAEGFLSRLMAMGHTHDLLSRRNWEGAELKMLVEQSLAPHVNHSRNNIVLEGPQLLVHPSSAAALSMIFHELTTNAAKYGALSNDHGRVTVRWQVEKADGPNRQLTLQWIEEGVANLKAPAREGFGLTFIRRSASHELNGSADFQFKNGSGLQVVLKAELPPVKDVS